MPSINVPTEFPECVGLFIGGCVERGDGSSFRAKAHAHYRNGRNSDGWICVRSAKRLWTADGRPSRLLWHEYAHIVANCGHTDKWRATMRKLKQPIPKRYQHKPQKAAR